MDELGEGFLKAGSKAASHSHGQEPKRYEPRRNLKCEEGISGKKEPSFFRSVSGINKKQEGKINYLKKALGQLRDPSPSMGNMSGGV